MTPIPTHGCTPADSAIEVGHIVFAQPGETFLGIEALPGRFPISAARFVDGQLLWGRNDGATERLDLRDSAHLGAVRDAFESVDGLMVMSYASLPNADADVAGVADVDLMDVAFVSAGQVDAQAGKLLLEVPRG